MSDSDKSSFLLYRARDAREGALLKAMLEENDIEAWVSGGQSALGFGELGADALLVDVRVRPEDAERARLLIDTFFEEPEDAVEGPWTCTGCGEENEAGFEACWGCGAERPVSGSTAGETAIEPAAPELPADARWAGWDVRLLRLFLACSFVCLLACVSVAVAELVGSLVGPGSEAPRAGEMSLRRTVVTLVFFALWIPSTIFTIRWGLAMPRPKPKAAEAD